VGVLQFLGGVGYNVGMEDNIMALTITVQSTEPIPTGEYTVELTAIELVDTQYGKQLKLDIRCTRPQAHAYCVFQSIIIPEKQVHTLGERTVEARDSGW
jgi:hypothetical protein